MIVRKRGARDKHKELVNKVTNKIKDLEHNPKRIYNTVRYFFSHYFKIRYAFTFEELKDEVKKSRLSNATKKGIINFADSLSETKYGPKGQEKKTLIKLKEQFKSLFLVLTEVEKEKIRKHDERVEKTRKPMPKFFSNVKKVINLKSKKAIADKTSLIHANATDHFEELVNEINYLYENKNFSKIKEKYRALMEAYTKLPIEDRKKCYPELVKVHSELLDIPQKTHSFKKKLEKLQGHMDKADTENVKKSYLEILQAYETLPSYEKEKQYGELKEILNKIKSSSFSS